MLFFMSSEFVFLLISRVIKMKVQSLKSVVFGAVCLSVALPIYAAGSNSGAIQFQGRITGDTCDVVINGATNPAIGIVQMGNWPASLFTTTGTEIGGTGGAGKLNIELLNCPAMTTASVELKGTIDASDPTHLKVDAGSGAADGVAIVIYDTKNTSSSTPIEINQAISYTPVPGGSLETDGTLSLAYEAKYISTKNTVTPGTANSSINYEITYN